MSLAVISTHPVQYQAPVYRAVQSRFDIPVTVIYGSDFSIVGYLDRGFGVTVAWDIDLVSGYTPIFLSRVSEGGARNVEEVSPRGLRKALLKARPKAVLMTGYGSRFHQIALLHTWMAGLPILFRSETTDHARRRNPVFDRTRDCLLKGFYRRCARLLYIGQRSHGHFKRLGLSEDKLVFSPYCVDIASFQWSETARELLRTRVRDELRITSKETVLLFSGKLISDKNPLLILRAVKALAPEVRHQIVVVFVGSGPLEREARDLAGVSPSVEVRFVGFQNQSQLSSYYHCADLLILPSCRNETWGLVVNEALHHGLPCLVSKEVGCAPDLVESGVTGEIFESGSAKELALVIQRSCQWIGNVETREACRSKVDRFSVQKAAEGIARAYQDAVERSIRR